MIMNKSISDDYNDDYDDEEQKVSYHKLNRKSQSTSA